MTFQEFITYLQRLALPMDFSYLPSSTSSDKNIYTLLSVSENEIRAKRDGSELSVSLTQINTIINNLSEYTPLDVEKTLGGSGNTRSIIESLFCLLPEIYHTRINNRKHIIYIPTKSHDLGVLTFISEIELHNLVLQYKKTKRKQIEEEFRDYLTNIAISKRSGKRFTQSAISSYLLFTSVEKLFDYAPEKWRKIENIYDITSMDLISKIIKDLKNEPDFCKRNREDNNGWRLGAINQYFDFLVYKNNNIKKEDIEIEEEPVIDENIDNKTFSVSSFSNDIYTSRYIKSLLAKTFVILTGNSGTGKTRISTRFAEYLEKKDDNKKINHLLIPVGADWTDNTKILGFYNPLRKEYQSTPVLDFILLADQNPDIPFFLILDEMNLSHVERYFSDFLSAMESGEPIPLYKKDADCESSIPEELVLPDNLFVTGTVNIDETTYMFSPKVLDRANVIEFKPEMSDVLDNLISSSEDISVKQAEPGVAESFMKLANEVRSGNMPVGVENILNDMKTVLESFYKELEKYGFEFAYRTAKEIRLYTIAAWLTAEGTKPNATDIADVQILQKILPKIHGNRKQIGELLDNLEKLCEEKVLKNSLAKIRQMKDHLNRFQYASFI